MQRPRGTRHSNTREGLSPQECKSSLFNCKLRPCHPEMKNRAKRQTSEVIPGSEQEGAQPESTAFGFEQLGLTCPCSVPGMQASAVGGRSALTDRRRDATTKSSRLRREPREEHWPDPGGQALRGQWGEGQERQCFGSDVITSEMNKDF